MSAKKKTDEAPAEEVAVEEAAQETNAGGFKQVEGHGWSDEEVAIRSWTGADGSPHPGAAAPVAMDTGTKSTK